MNILKSYCDCMSLRIILLRWTGERLLHRQPPRWSGKPIIKKEM